MNIAFKLHKIHENHTSNANTIHTYIEPTLGEIAYMKTQEAMMANSTSQVKEANFLNNRGYVFRPNNNLPTHYRPRLRNHENLSYGNQEIVPHVPHHLSVSNTPPGFQGKELRAPIIKGKEDHHFLKRISCIF